ncbi:unnamed protein product [Vicia faba]|uniref:Retrovirus-related Pol polyprotein from transposon TNT 1-94 n=1 Tax=Vicia faba TaxID=3906 RepID=A0AAV0ZDR1_VICFA|nr:unnamed protein product [Vicia faba]
MKARVRQLRIELKSTKKGNKFVTEFLLRIKVIANSLLAVGDLITEQDQIDSILNGLPEEYNPFVMQKYGCPVPPTLCDVEGLLYVKETQHDKFRQELVANTVSANIAHTGQKEESCRGNYSRNHGRGHKYSRGRGRGRTIASTGNRPTCPLCGKYGHSVSTCWPRFDENFMP